MIGVRRCLCLQTFHFPMRGPSSQEETTRGTEDDCNPGYACCPRRPGWTGRCNLCSSWSAPVVFCSPPPHLTRSLRRTRRARGSFPRTRRIRGKARRWRGMVLHSMEPWSEGRGDDSGKEMRWWLWWRERGRLGRSAVDGRIASNGPPLVPSPLPCPTVPPCFFPISKGRR
jgi:hypothetical protein